MAHRAIEHLLRSREWHFHGLGVAADGEELTVKVVSALSGEGLSTLCLPGQSQVLQVKRCVETAHGIGVFRQRLLLPTGRHLENHEVLGSLGAAAAAAETPAAEEEAGLEVPRLVEWLLSSSPLTPFGSSS